MSDPTPPRRGISRRAFVAATAVGGAGLAVAGYSGVALARDDLQPELDTSAPTGSLDPSRMDTLLALGEILVPDRFRVAPTRMRQLINEATQQEPGVLKAYREGAGLLDRLSQTRSGAAFRELPAEARDRILSGALWRYPAETGDAFDDTVTKVKRRLERAWHDGAHRRLRELVVRDLLRRMYEAAVPSLIGYSNLPGVPGDPRAYVDRPRT